MTCVSFIYIYLDAETSCIFLCVAHSIKIDPIGIKCSQVNINRVLSVNKFKL